MRITDIQIHSVEHATSHGVSVEEIEQALLNDLDKPEIKRNRKDQKAEFIARGTTHGGSTIYIPLDITGTTAWVYTAWREGT